MRELEAVLEVAMIRRQSGRLEPADLTLDPTPGASIPTPPGSASDPARPPAADARSDRDATALQLAASEGAVTRSALALACGISGDLARQVLTSLTARGRLRRVGAGRGARYVLP